MLSLKEKKGKKWILLYFITILIPTIIGFIFFTVNVYWADLNLIVSDYLGFDFNLILIIYLVLFFPIIYASVLLYKAISEILKKDQYKPHIINAILSNGLSILFAIIGINLVEYLNSYVKLAFQIYDYYFIPAYAIILLILIILSYPLLKSFPKLAQLFSNRVITAENKKLIITILLLVSYFLAFLYPFLNRPANTLSFENLPPKPDLIAHRGGSQLGPENTIEVIQTSIEYNIVGWEVDIAISKDGIPFLMHDSTLTRTTNVEEIFPERKNDAPYTFTWEELQQLNAGSWYVEKDPWGLIASGAITEEQVSRYKTAKIPSFEEVLEFTRDHGLRLDFDTRSPPSSHPYSDVYSEILIRLTITTGVNLSKIMIPTLSNNWLDLIDKYDAQEIWTYKNYDNTGDSYSDEEYREAYLNDFPIMVYTINSIERFEQLWCLGVKWVKTDAPYKFESIKGPRLYLFLYQYYILLGIMSILMVSTVLRVRVITKKKRSAG